MPAAEGSPLAVVLGLVAAKRDATYLDLRVDGLSDAVGHDVIVRYAAKVPADLLAKRMARLGPQASLFAAYLSVLVDLCHGVYAVIDGVSYGMSADAPTDPGDWPRFDDDLRGVLPDGVEQRATAIARALFEAGHAADNVTQAHAEIMGHGRRVMRWAGLNDPVGGDDGLGG